MVAWRHLLPPVTLLVTVPLGKELRHRLCWALSHLRPWVLASVLVTVHELVGGADCVQRLRVTALAVALELHTV